MHKTENSIDNDLFDQESIQNFFRGFGFVRAHVPRVVEMSQDRAYVWINPNAPVRPVTKMAHRSSSAKMLMACVCSPCICIALPCYLSVLCVDEIRERIKRN